jgi:hypothetical protein
MKPLVIALVFLALSASAYPQSEASVDASGKGSILQNSISTGNVLNKFFICNVETNFYSQNKCRFRFI